MSDNLTEAQTTPTLLPLTPGKLSPEELAAYEQEFNLVFDKPELRNIAVSGATGSGKSTVMNSWRDAHPDHGCPAASPHRPGCRRARVQRGNHDRALRFGEPGRGEEYLPLPGERGCDFQLFSFI